MDYIGSDFNSLGSVIPKADLTAARLKRGECATCGRKCYRKKLFKMIPINDEDGKILNGCCLHCNPHSNEIVNSTTHSHSSTNRKPRRIDIQHSDGAIMSVIATTKYDIDGVSAVERQNSSSRPPERSLSSPPSSQPTISVTKNGNNYSGRSERSIGNASAPATTLPSQFPSSDLPTAYSRSTQHETYTDIESITSPTHTRFSRSFSHQGSHHSIRSTSTSGTATYATRCSDHCQRPPSRQNSTNSNTADSVHTVSSHLEQTSRQEIKKAALVLMAAAKEHGLRDDRGTFVSSLQDIVNSGDSIDVLGTSDTTCTATTSFTNDGVKLNDFYVGYEGGDKLATQEERVLDRGGSFPMRSGRLVYTGSTRTLSSMSSIEEGDQHYPSTHTQSSKGQQILRARGISSRTLGSLSTIDGINEEEIHSFIGDHSGIDKKGPTPSDERSDTGQPSLNSVTLLDESTHGHEQNYNKCYEEAKDHVTEIESILQCLKDSTSCSSHVRAMEALKWLSESLSFMLDNPGSWLKHYIDKCLIEVIVSIMGRYRESPKIQVDACEVLIKFVLLDNSNENTEFRSSQIIAERAGETLLFSSMILHEDNLTVQEAALRTIRCLCEDFSENQITFWKLDSIQPILRAMEKNLSEPRVQKTGADIVLMLASNPENEHARSSIGVNGGIYAMIRAISMHLGDLQVVESCSHTLSILVMDCHDNAVVVCQTPGAIIALLDTIQSHIQNRAINEIGCAIFAHLTKEAEHVDFLLSHRTLLEAKEANRESNVKEKPNDLLERIIETILESIQTHSECSIVQDFGFAVLANLTDTDETKMFMVDIGALDAIVLAMVLHKDHGGVQERVCSLLMQLAIQDNHQHILAANPVELIKTAAHKFPEACLEPASQLLHQLGLEFEHRLRVD